MSARLNLLIEGIAFAISLMAVAIVSVSFFALGGWMDGKINPVIKNFAVETWVLEPQQKQSGILAGSFFKARDCKFKGVSIYASDRLGEAEDKRRVERLSWRFYDQPAMTTGSRPPGQQDFGPWEIFAPRDERLRFVHITVFHECWYVFNREQELVVLEWPPE